MLDKIIYNIIDLRVIIVKIHARRNHLKNFLHQVIKRLKAVTVEADLQKSKTLLVRSQALAIDGRLN